MAISTRPSWFAHPSLAIATASLVGLAAIALGPRLGAQAGSPRPTDRGMFVSVVDRDGRPVTGLTASDFLVREDGVEREVVSAHRATDPIDLALLVDTSQAGTSYLPDVRRALGRFVKRMAGPNHVAIVGFGERPIFYANYTRDLTLLQQGIDRLFPISGSGSYLLEAVDETCAGLAKRDSERAVIVAITAGGPEFSERDYEAFVSTLRQSGATFDALVFSLESPNLADFGQRNREQFLDAATGATGGQRILLLSSMAVDGALDRLGDELAGQYRVTYGRPDRLIPPRKIEVSVRREGLTARGTPILARAR
jgi:VWFA-related protein